MRAFRAMQPADIAAVLRIQAECYQAALLEDEAAIRQRLLAAPQTAWVAADGDGVCAYLAAYPSRIGAITALGGQFELPALPDTLYLHDLAVARRVRGEGVGPALAAFSWEQGVSLGLRFSSLVSVQDSLPYWQRLGYEIQADLTPQQQARLATYPGPSCYMIKKL